MMSGRLAQEDGFATLELRIVLVLIVVLLTIPIASFAALRRGAGDTTARANLRVAIAQADAHHLQYDTYAGLTPAAVESRQSRRSDRPRYVITNLSKTTYCISSTVGGHSWMKAGPRGAVVKGTCS
jgi:Tfp pilus assembly protein PilE